MAIVTLISDFGNKDYYVPALKGNLLSSIPEVRIVDITNEIEPHDIIEAGFILKNTFSSFPAGTIHICYVKNHEPDQHLIFTKYQDQYFIGPNNGIFSLVFDDDVSFYKLKDNVYMPFKELGELIRSLISGEPIENIGLPCKQIKERIGLSPIVYTDQIRASVIHTDRYGNLVLNVTGTLFEETRKGRRFKIYFKRLDPITKISESYTDGNVGQPIALFNSSGHLVLAVNMSNASEDLNLKKEDIIQILFE
ncbi:MAG: SAM-dependent chlorinase/fluorinase [Saprospiraceae bacterium]|nr:SAM-dependent chlorinase/fluorinase [Saprospiraceae bacterium]